MADIRFHNTIDPFGEMLKGYDDRIKSTYDRALKEVQLKKAYQSLRHGGAGEGRAADLQKLRMQLLEQNLKNAQENARLLPQTHDAQLSILQEKARLNDAQGAYERSVLGYQKQLLPEQFKQANDALTQQPGPQQHFGAGRTLNRGAQPAGQPGAAQPSGVPGITIDQPKPMHLGGPGDSYLGRDKNPFNNPMSTDSLANDHVPPFVPWPSMQADAWTDDKNQDYEQATMRGYDARYDPQKQPGRAPYLPNPHSNFDASGRFQNFLDVDADEQAELDSPEK